MTYGVKCQLEVKTGDQLKVMIEDKVYKIEEELITVLDNVPFIRVTITGVKIDSFVYIIVACFWV